MWYRERERNWGDRGAAWSLMAVNWRCHARHPRDAALVHDAASFDAVEQLDLVVRICSVLLVQCSYRFDNRMNGANDCRQLSVGSLKQPCMVPFRTLAPMITTLHRQVIVRKFRYRGFFAIRESGLK
jgi:hypothetical protein